MPDPIHTVAIFNASDDTTDMLAVLLSQRGCRPLTEEVDHIKSGTLDFMAFMGAQRPDAIIWDIAPPYERNWNFFKLWRNADVLQNCHVVLTTTNKTHLDRLVGHAAKGLDIIGTPYDLEAIADAVVQGIEGRRGPDQGRPPF